MSLDLIREAGIKLHMNEECVATACTFYHMFCSTMTEENYESSLLVMATLNLASKVQEHPSLKLGEVVNTCHRCLHKDEPPLEVCDLYWQLKDSIAKYELLLLRALKFKVHFQLPHSYLLHFLLALSRWIDEATWHRSHVTPIAWALLQDSYHTNLCILYPPNVIATSVLYLSLICCKVRVPGDWKLLRTEYGGGIQQVRTSEGERECVIQDSRAREWWQVFSPGVKEVELQEIASKIMAVYDDENSCHSSSSRPTLTVTTTLSKK